MIGLVDINELREGDTVWINGKCELPQYLFQSYTNNGIIELNVLETDFEYQGQLVPIMECTTMSWDKNTCLKETYKNFGYSGFTEVEKLEFICRIEELIVL